VHEAIDLIWKFSVLAGLAVAARLLLQGLAGEYPALLAACCILPVKSVLLMLSYNHRLPHQQMREAARQLDPIEWIVSAWVVFELFSWWTKSYKGIGRFGKILLTIFLTGAVLVSMTFYHAEWEALVFAGNFKIYYILNRIVWVTLALFVLGTWLFFRNYPVAIAPNVIRHTQISVVYFAVNALSYLTFTLNGLKVVTLINFAIVTCTTGCFFAWAVLLTRKAQARPPQQQVSLEDKTRIEQINQDLLVFMGNFPKGDH
jgi:hypothetical protein